MRADKSFATITSTDYAALSKILAATLGALPPTKSELIAAVEQIMHPSQNEMFFSRIPILFEGAEDVGIISTWLHRRNAWPEFRRLGCHFVICEGKTNMSRPLAIANLLGLPAFTVFDGDCDKATGDQKNNHVRDNSCILTLSGNDPTPLPADNVFGKRVVMWRTRIMDEIKNEIGANLWERSENEVRAEKDMLHNVKSKNPLLVAATIEYLLDNAIAIGHLDKLCDSIMNFATDA